MNKIVLFFLLMLPGVYGYSQEQLKISGYIQTQWTWNHENVPAGDQNNFSIRRGRFKAAYTNAYGEAVIQLDATDNGVKIKDAYLKLLTPNIQWGALRGGIFDRPFGYEISYSSSLRESPERSRVFLTLFPRERDLGAELIFKGLANTSFEPLTLNVGLFSGNGGQAKETDSGKDFIGHLSYKKKSGCFSYGLGFSLYAGGVRLAGDEQQKAYKMVSGQFVEDAGLKPGDYAKRQYYGFDAQGSVSLGLGITNLRGEYLWGIQPGAINGSESPTGAITADIYLRNFRGYYIQLVQDIGTSKHSLAVKYDAYDPNTKISKSQSQTVGDVSYSTYGFGWLFRPNRNLRVMCYYELPYNEKVNNAVVGDIYNTNIKDDVFTLQLQYKF